MCFSKNDIYSISRQIEARGQECAVIYGSLPPGEFMRDAAGRCMTYLELLLVNHVVLHILCLLKLFGWSLCN